MALICIEIQLLILRQVLHRDPGQIHATPCVVILAARTLVKERKGTATYS